MSGDVFGNGMLLSEHIRLVAAFDHRHIFLDPDPDAAVSYAERRRLFQLPRSSWADYDATLTSPGGGVHPRTSKSIPVTKQVAAALGIDSEVTAMTPTELIHAILARAGRPAVERRHRHLRQGKHRDEHRGRRQGQRWAARRRRRPAVPGRRRGRQPGVHPARPRRVRPQRRAHQHRRHRQLRRGGHLRPRGEHKDPARPRGRRRPDRHRRTPEAARPRSPTTSRRWCCGTTTSRT